MTACLTKRQQHAACFFSIMMLWHVPIRAFKLGVENLSHPSFNALVCSSSHAPRVGLISNQTAHDQSGNRTVDILRTRHVRITYILAPEHGFDGTIPAGKPVLHSVDTKTGIPIVSIYGTGGDNTISGKRINPSILKQLDALVYDIQDSGMRHHTYISTLLCALEAAALYNKPLYVLDRPNLLGAFMEGPLVESHLKSFISIAPIPLRHGMTVGELANYFNTYILDKPARLHVIPLAQYNRIMHIPFLRALSPNLASQQSLYGYSFLGLLGEIHPFHVGVGSSHAFQVLMLPDALNIARFDWDRLAQILKAYGISAQYATMSKREEPHSGLYLQFMKREFAAFDVFIKVVSFFKQRNVKLSFSSVFNKAIGTTRFCQWHEGRCSMTSLINTIRNELKAFHAKAQQCFLYKPDPIIKT